MSARSLMTFLAATMVAGCAVPDIYSLPDLAGSKAQAGKGRRLMRPLFCS